MPPKKTNGLTDDDLDAIEDLASAASPGPWRWWDLTDSHGGIHEDGLVPWIGPGMLPCDRVFGLAPPGCEYDSESSVIHLPEQSMLAEDADFIAAARSAVPALLTEVRWLRMLTHDLREDSLAYQRGLADGLRQAAKMTPEELQKGVADA